MSRPLGVVCAISPWNLPFMLSFLKVLPALLVGDTVVLKPSPFTPLTVLRAADYIRNLLPPGVLNVITGGDRLGPWMTAHPGVNKIAFTGSTQTGRRVLGSAAETLIRSRGDARADPEPASVGSAQRGLGRNPARRCRGALPGRITRRQRRSVLPDHHSRQPTVRRTLREPGKLRPAAFDHKVPYRRRSHPKGERYALTTINSKRVSWMR
jgi:hypothetical protein